MHKRIILFLMLLLLVSLACTLSSLSENSGGEEIARTYNPRIVVSPVGAEPGSDIYVEFQDFPPYADLEVNVIYAETSQVVQTFYIS